MIDSVRLFGRHSVPLVRPMPYQALPWIHHCFTAKKMFTPFLDKRANNDIKLKL